MPIPPQFNQEDAFNAIVRFLRDRRTGSAIDRGDYGYDVFLPNVIRKYVEVDAGIEEHCVEQSMEVVARPFYDAAWEMCRRGILRLSTSTWRSGSQSHDPPTGSGYSITPAGENWIANGVGYDYVPIEPGRFALLLDAYTSRFGEGFRERSQEAIRCYGNNAFLACCAMCGAAAESILLAVAIAKTGDEGQVLKSYQAAGGRAKVENLIIGRQQLNIQDEFRSQAGLLKYWRDSAAHGRRTNIADNEAYTSLALLLRFAQFVNDRWTILSAP